MASVKWGSSGSKETVQCFYCETKTRLDNLERHSKVQHPGKPVKHKVIVASNQRTLFQIFKKKVDYKRPSESQGESEEKREDLSKIIETEEHDSGTTDKPEEAEETDIFVSKKRSGDSDSDVGPVPPKKRYLENMLDVSTIAELIKETNNSVIKQIQASERTIIESIETTKSHYESVSVNVNQMKEKKLKNVEKSDEISRGDLASCKDLDSLVKYLEENKFVYDEEKDIITCTICTSQCEGSEKNVKEQNTGYFKVNREKYNFQKFGNPNQQPKAFGHLKSHIAEHLFGAQGREGSAYHQKQLRRIEAEKQEESEREARSYTAGMNLFRIRYNQIMQGNSYNSFESVVLTAKLNKCEVGDLNHSRIFAKALTKDIAATMDVNLKEALSQNLDCTNQPPPVGMVMDKMTPNKRTGQIHAIIVPVPSKPLSDTMLAPVMLKVPPVINHDAAGLAKMAKDVLNDAGVKDSQLEGVGWDGQYVLLGVMKKLIELLSIPGMDTNDKQKWITQMWEPAHNIELATKDIREMTTVFDWFVGHISIVNGITQALNIGKGLEQCLTAAEEQNRRLYRLTNLSTTRFSAYFERSLSNFEKDFPVIVQALQTRLTDSAEKDVREQAQDWLMKILTKNFIMVHLGLIDIYRVLGTYSSLLQTVEQFPWTVIQRVRELIQCLKDMSEMKLTPTEEEEEGEIANVNVCIDKKRWPKLSQHVDSVLTDQYHGLSTARDVERRRGRSAADVGNNDIMRTVENRLTSLCKILAERIEKRTIKNDKYPLPDLFQLMAGCFELQNLLQTRAEDYGVVELEKLLKLACCSQEITVNVLAQYEIFKSRLFALIDDQDNSLLTSVKHLCYETHQCTSECNVKYYKNYKDFQKLKEPKVVISLKFYHLFLREKDLYTGIEDFLHFFLRCTSKTHAEGVAESMGNYVEIHSDKRRGLDISDVGLEARIHWNGPPIHHATRLGESALDRHFGGRRRWHFVTKNNNKESLVTKRLKQEKPKLPFF